MTEEKPGAYFRIVLQDPESGSETLVGQLSRPSDDVPWHLWLDLDGWGIDARVPVAGAPDLVDAITEARALAEKNLPEALARILRGEDPETGKRPLRSLVRKPEKPIKSSE